jgi:AraC-like DNA-binding protein/quercetin dioxygenase-like cupin family protein
MTTLDLERTPEREILDLSTLGLHGARVLGRYRYRTPHTPLPAHRHPGMIEICYLHRGHQTYELEGRRYLLRGGDVLVTMPGEWHSTGPDPENRGVLYWLILQPTSRRRGFLGLSRQDAGTLARALGRLPSRHFRAPRGCHAALEAMLAGSWSDGSLDPIARRCSLVGLLLDLIAASHQRAIRGSEEWLVPVLRLMHDQLDRQRQVPEFAAVAGLSVSHFKARFRDATGTAPAEYFLGLRIEEAQRRLRETPAPVTRIAMDLGFGSSQSFATAFHRLVGCAPSAYRRTMH